MPLDTPGSAYPSGKNFWKGAPSEETDGGAVAMAFFAVLIGLWVASRVWEFLLSRYSKYHSAENVARRAAEAERLRLEEKQRQDVLTAMESRRLEELAEAERKRREREEKRTAIPRLTTWYEEQKREIERAVPPGKDRDVLLLTLWSRYDTLLKETLREMKP